MSEHVDLGVRVDFGESICQQGDRQRQVFSQKMTAFIKINAMFIKHNGALWIRLRTHQSTSGPAVRQLHTGARADNVMRSPTKIRISLSYARLKDIFLHTFTRYHKMFV